jgi:hypothetical protein
MVLVSFFAAITPASVPDTLRRSLRERRERARGHRRRAAEHSNEVSPPHSAASHVKATIYHLGSGLVRHSKAVLPMSALGQKQTSHWVGVMSALPPKADIGPKSLTDEDYVPAPGMKQRICVSVTTAASGTTIHSP